MVVDNEYLHRSPAPPGAGRFASEFTAVSPSRKPAIRFVGPAEASAEPAHAFRHRAQPDRHWPGPPSRAVIGDLHHNSTPSPEPPTVRSTRIATSVG